MGDWAGLRRGRRARGAASSTGALGAGTAAAAGPSAPPRSCRGSVLALGACVHERVSFVAFFLTQYLSSVYFCHTNLSFVFTLAFATISLICRRCAQPLVVVVVFGPGRQRLRGRRARHPQKVQVSSCPPAGNETVYVGRYCPFFLCRHFDSLLVCGAYVTFLCCSWCAC